ncbi:hypothetical protein DYB30_012070 [Aphanomyces astaci]|uniref:Uncharacterized protein n=1 Tax=Aphanomyces astaci TaxID=112090 RepID=A0A397CGZ9_APHAT|nr:hypothetical protein DYB30_012070 [Aphanomyces astaci]
MHTREVHHLADERWFRGKHQFLLHWARPELLGKTTSWVPVSYLSTCSEALGSYHRWKAFCQKKGENLSFAKFRSYDAHWLDFRSYATNTCLIAAFRIAATLLNVPLNVSDDDMGEFMANHKIDANDGIPPAALRSFVRFLGTKGFRFCHQTFAENLLLDPTGNTQLDLFATVKRGGEGVYLLTTVTDNLSHSWVVHCDGLQTKVIDSVGTVPLGKFPHVDYIQTIRHLSLFKKQRRHKRKKRDSE